MPENSSEGFALQLFESAPETVYSIEIISAITHTPRHQIALYCRSGLLSPAASPDDNGWTFDDQAIRKLRLIESLRTSYGVNVAGLQLIAELLQDREQLQEEIRFLRRS